jgi:intein/homing endonuclease
MSSNKKLTQQELLKQRIREEYQRCSQDCVYFFKKYAIIQHPTKGKINFNLYQFQEDVLPQLEEYRYNIVLKGRQLGLSTLTAGFALWKMIFNDDFKVLVIATTQDVAKELVSKVQLMYEKLPVWLRKTAKKDVFNKLELSFQNGSKINAVSSSEKSARSPSITLLIVDEAAFIDKMDEIWTAAQATLACVDYNTLLLTPNGLVRIGDLSDESYSYGFNDCDIDIINHDGEVEKSNSFFISNESEVYEVELANGNKIITTKEHPLMTDNGWCRVDSLSVGDNIRCIYNTQLFGESIKYPSFELHRNAKNKLKNVSNLDLAYFYGLYIAEGNRGSDRNRKHPSINITNVDPDIQKFIIDKFGFKLLDDRHLRLYSSHLSEYMKYVGIDYSTAKYKKVPHRILTASKDEQVEFLKGLFDGDGCATDRGAVKYSSTSKQLIHDVQQMLFNFGIRSKIKYAENKISKTSIIYKRNPNFMCRGYELYVNGEYARKFFDDIGFGLDRKQSRRNYCVDGRYIPVGKKLVSRLIENSEYTYNYVKYNIANVTRLLYSGSSSITAFSMKSLLDNIDPDVDGWDELKAIYDKHTDDKFYYEPVVSIKCIDSRITYDLKVPESHAFIANSMVNHNTGGNAVLLSTPNGQGNLFHKIWMEATEGSHEALDEPFNPILLPWNLHPDRDEIWARKEKNKLGVRKFAQEHACDFISSGHTVIEGELLQWYKDNMVKEPIEKRYSGDLWIWKHPDYTKSYMTIADVARGDGEDYSAFHIFDVETMEQVAEFKAKIGTREFGNLLVSISTEWNNALLVIDNKNMGWDVVQVALDRNYSNLYYSYKNDPFFDENIHLRKNYDLKNKKDMVPGMTLGHKIRMNLISKLEIYFREKAIIIHSIRTINELFVFLWINGKAQAQSGYNDDLVISLAMGLFVRDTALRLRQVGIDLTKRTLSKTHRSVYKPSRAGEDSWKMKLGGSNGSEDLRWLLNR